MLINLRIPEHQLRSSQASFTGVKRSLREVTSRGPFPVRLGQKAFPKNAHQSPVFASLVPSSWVSSLPNEATVMEIGQSRRWLASARFPSRQVAYSRHGGARARGERAAAACVPGMWRACPQITAVVTLFGFNCIRGFVRSRLMRHLLLTRKQFRGHTFQQYV